jgi:HAMP domain-containing protein
VESSYIVSSIGENVADTWISRDPTSTTEQSEHDGAFIAAADPPTIVAALDEIERLRAEVERLRDALTPFASVPVPLVRVLDTVTVHPSATSVSLS